MSSHFPPSSVCVNVTGLLAAMELQLLQSEKHFVAWLQVVTKAAQQLPHQVQRTQSAVCQQAMQQLMVVVRLEQRLLGHLAMLPCQQPSQVPFPNPSL